MFTNSSSIVRFVQKMLSITFFTIANKTSTANKKANCEFLIKYVNFFMCRKIVTFCYKRKSIKNNKFSTAKELLKGNGSIENR